MTQALKNVVWTEIKEALTTRQIVAECNTPASGHSELTSKKDRKQEKKTQTN
jgi:hypothetical protein